MKYTNAVVLLLLSCWRLWSADSDVKPRPYQFTGSANEPDVPRADGKLKFTEDAEKAFEYLYPNVEILEIGTTEEKSGDHKFTAYSITAGDSAKNSFKVTMTASGKLLEQSERTESVDKLPVAVLETANRRAPGVEWTSASSYSALKFSQKGIFGSKSPTPAAPIFHELKGKLDKKKVKVVVSQAGMLIKSDDLPRTDVALIEFMGVWPRSVVGAIEGGLQINNGIFAKSPMEFFPGTYNLWVYLDGWEMTVGGQNHIWSTELAPLQITVEEGKQYIVSWNITNRKSGQWKPVFVEKKKK